MTRRKLEGAYPYLIVDAWYEKVWVGGRVVSRGALLVIGVSEAGYREILGTRVADTESEAAWSDVFRDLRERGLTGVRYAVSDQHPSTGAHTIFILKYYYFSSCEVKNSFLHSSHSEDTNI